MSRDERDWTSVDETNQTDRQTNRQTEMKRKRREFILVLQAAHATQPHLPHLPPEPNPLVAIVRFFPKCPCSKTTETTSLRD